MDRSTAKCLLPFHGWGEKNNKEVLLSKVLKLVQVWDNLEFKMYFQMILFKVIRPYGNYLQGFVYEAGKLQTI